MRVNPKHNNTCANRIGMYRSGQCTDGPRPCVFLSECDMHYDEKTGDWYGYSGSLENKPEIVPMKRRGRYGCGNRPHGGASSPSRLVDHRRRERIKKGLEAPREITTTLSEALEVAGL